MEHEVFDTTFSSLQKFKQHLIKSKPDHLGIYVNLMTKVNVLQIIQFVKAHLPMCVVILGGPEVRYNAQSFLTHGADYIVIGEGEEAMLELVSALLNKASTEEIRGIAFLRQEEFIQTPEREKIKELDQLPIPNRKKIDLQLYLDAWKSRHGKNAISISTMRGCPYTCKWCSRAVYGLSYRRRSPQMVVAELALVKKEYNPDSFWFVDDVFTISYKWLREFRDELMKQNVSIEFECITRADRMNEEVVQILKQTGCFRVWIGAESGSQRVIDLMDRRVDVKQVRDMIKLSKHQGIEAGTFIMLGYPGETEDDIEKTIQHLKDCDPTFFTITIAYPIRGTEMYGEIESLDTSSNNWATTSDRQIDFKRTYPRKYYDFAFARVVNEVNYHKAKKSGLSLKVVSLKIKSVVSKMGMRFYRLAYA
jgi:radical SAM superfamily enzyme YgiQ (UPF0313 family)